MNNSESKKRLLALQKSKFLSVEIQDALRFAIEKLSDAEYHDALKPQPVMANKRWSQAEENQLVESLLAGNSIELIATNLSRSTNNVFSRLLLLKSTHHRLLEPIGYIPPAEAEDNYYRQLASQTATTE